MRKIVLGGMLTLALFIAGCASNPALLDSDITPEELVQRGQEAAERGRYKLALAYYQEILTRFPTNIDMVCAAEYEIAHIHYKQKKYTMARAELNALLSRYDDSDEELLPSQFKRLCAVVLELIDEKESKQGQIRNFFKKSSGSSKKSKAG